MNIRYRGIEADDDRPRILVNIEAVATGQDLHPGHLDTLYTYIKGIVSEWFAPAPFDLTIGTYIEDEDDYDEDAYPGLTFIDQAEAIAEQAIPAGDWRKGDKRG